MVACTLSKKRYKMKRPKLIFDMAKMSGISAPIDYSEHRSITAADLVKLDRKINQPMIYTTTTATIYKNQSQSHMVEENCILKVYINDKQSRIILHCRRPCNNKHATAGYYYNDRIFEIAKTDHLSRTLNRAGQTLRCRLSCLNGTTFEYKRSKFTECTTESVKFMFGKAYMII
jgi:hypothetical protein